ncbi:MAG TPA: hypothetical protein VF627_13055 [Abditibacterium sp.]|jgi:hypothetical protein
MPTPQATPFEPLLIEEAEPQHALPAPPEVLPEAAVYVGLPEVVAVLPEGSEDYMIQTSQEVDALMRAACDARMGQNWETDDQAFTRSHAVPGSLHHVQLTLSDDERAAGVPLRVLEDLTFAQDPDFNFALLYISRLLAPPSPLPPKNLASEWIDLDDVLDKIGWNPRSTKERIAMRSRVWRYLLFGARASIVGQRRGEYVDRKTGERIETIIDEPAWLVVSKEKAAQPRLFPDVGEVPLRVELAASRAWTRLTTLPETAQYLPMGELLGAIPGNKPSGAWARVLGLALANFWRRQPRAATDGGLKPSRRELLDRYTPKAAAPRDVLSSINPRRAIEYWHGALQILVENGFLAREGEALLSYKAMRERLPRQDWQEHWLDESVELRPGARMQPAVLSCANALPAPKPRVLGAGSSAATSSPAKRGKPRRKRNTREENASSS